MDDHVHHFVPVRVKKDVYEQRCSCGETPISAAQGQELTAPVRQELFAIQTYPIPTNAAEKRSMDILLGKGSAFKARYDTRYIEELQQRWDDAFEVCGGPFMKVFQFTGAQVGEGIIAHVNKRTFVYLASQE